MPEPLTVLSPLAGTVLELEAVPDPVFAAGMVGPGLALLPDDDGAGDVASPVDGVVGALRGHAVVVEADGGRGVLVHLGVDSLHGVGFSAVVAVGATVGAGDPVLRWDPAALEASGASAVCPVVALGAAPAAVELLVAPGDRVAVGDPLLRWV